MIVCAYLCKVLQSPFELQHCDGIVMTKRDSLSICNMYLYFPPSHNTVGLAMDHQSSSFSRLCTIIHNAKLLVAQ